MNKVHDSSLPGTPIEGGMGSFLQDANKDIYGAKIEPLTFHDVEKNGFKVEWALKGADLIIHIYRARNAKWSLNYAKLLYALMDKHAPGESRDIGYEDMVDSWYIKSDGYASGKLDPNITARKLCEKVLNELV